MLSFLSTSLICGSAGHRVQVKNCRSEIRCPNQRYHASIYILIINSFFILPPNRINPLVIIFMVFLSCITSSEAKLFDFKDSLNNNKKRSHTQLDSRKQVIAFQDRVITINIKEAQHPLKREKQVIDKFSIMLKISTKSMHLKSS